MVSSKKTIKKAEAIAIKNVEKVNKTFSLMSTNYKDKAGYHSSNESEYQEWETAYMPVSILQEKYQMSECQSARFVKDYKMVISLGADLINKHNCGWDGFFTKYNIPFENKNLKFNYKGKDSLGTKLQDTSRGKLEVFKSGVIITFTVWKSVINPAYTIIGNTKTIGDVIEKKMLKIIDDMITEEEKGDKRTNRRMSPSVSFTDMMNGGFKIVALNMTKEEVLDRLMISQKSYASAITTDDIYSKEDLPKIVEELASL